MLNVNIRNRNLIINFVGIGFLGTDFKASFAVWIPSWFGIFVYKDFTSKIKRNISSDMFSTSLILLIKSDVSLIVVGNASTCGLRKWSTNFKILLIWHSTELTTGLLGMLYVFLVKYEIVVF